MKIKLEWKKEDLWVGLFWRHEVRETHLWICFVPCLPLHVTWARRGRTV